MSAIECLNRNVNPSIRLWSLPTAGKPFPRQRPAPSLPSRFRQRSGGPAVLPAAERRGGRVRPGRRSCRRGAQPPARRGGPGGAAAAHRGRAVGLPRCRREEPPVRSAGCHSGVGEAPSKAEGREGSAAPAARTGSAPAAARHAAVRAAAAPLPAGRGAPGPPPRSRRGAESHRLVPAAPRPQPLRAAAPGLAGPCEKDAGERLQGGEGGGAGEEERRAPAALEEEALHPHRRGAAPHPSQAAAAATAAAAAAAAGRAGGQDQGASLLQHEDGGLRGAEGQVRVLHGGDGRGEGDRLSVRTGARLERGDHAADGAVQEPPSHPRRPLHPPEAAAPGAAPRPAPPQRLQLRLAQVKLTKRFGEAGLRAFVADILQLVKNWANAGDAGRLERSGATT